MAPTMKPPIVHLTEEELALVDKTMRKDHGTATDAWNIVNAKRRLHGTRELEKSAVHRYVRGRSHQRGQSIERRGRKRKLSKQNERELDQARVRLLKRADGEFGVTYHDIVKEAGLDGKVCQRICEDALRAKGVAYRKPRNKIQISEKDAKCRKAVCDKWAKRPAGYWERHVHAYVDNKSWVMPLTPAQRAKYKQTLITGHLRKAREGTARGMTKPRGQHSFLGMPSIAITAAVAKDRVILWHENRSNWNGATAAEMYKGPLIQSLRRTWGPRASYTIVEDGDRKGNQSTKGIAAKQKVGIKAMTLPPRTPSLMPLDYAIWKAIDAKVVDTSPRGTETKAAFLERLRRCAKSLPSGFVKRQIARMKANVKAIVDAQGWCPKND